jgi:toxin ParE1/3/4
VNYNVIMLPEARDDLFEIYKYIARNDSMAKADTLLNRIEEKCLSLCTLPERGNTVNELERVYVEGFRQIHFKPYRIIFQVIGKKVFVHAILDGRRELQELLERRILG